MLEGLLMIAVSLFGIYIIERNEEIEEIEA